ncbi:MAG TPA: glycosyltransferase family 1 protein [Anaerolineales bacterium]|nr:glycosyltransferase family 1 protein [Anaerolineales bacterium]
MRIGIMLRSIDEKGGVGVYTRNIVKELLELDSKNEYVLFYANPANIGTFAHHKNATELWVKGSNKAIWDQIAIPRACRRENLDVLFHPKFTVPLFAPCKAVMVVHGADWLIPEQAQFYTWLDVQYMRMMLPLYFKKSAVVVSVSQETTDNFNRVLDLPERKVQTIYFAPARNFKRITDADVLQKVKAKYDLPDEFILTLTKRKGGGRKNLGQIFKAYAHYHGQTDNPHKLVIGGKDCHLFRDEYGIPTDGYGKDILFPDWIDQTDMPAVFSLASLYLYPSNLEAFPIPLTEAMACGTPILTSNINGLKEIAGEAALLMDPNDTVSISDGILKIISDEQLRESLSNKGLERSKLFTWDLCARKTLDLLERVAIT